MNITSICNLLVCWPSRSLSESAFDLTEIKTRIDQTTYIHKDIRSRKWLIFNKNNNLLFSACTSLGEIFEGVVAIFMNFLVQRNNLGFLYWQHAKLHRTSSMAKCMSRQINKFDEWSWCNDLRHESFDNFSRMGPITFNIIARVEWQAIPYMQPWIQLGIRFYILSRGKKNLE